jgi:hypothetical protein
MHCSKLASFMKSLSTYFNAGVPAITINAIFMKHLFFGLSMLFWAHAGAQTILSDDFFKEDNQRFIQTACEQLSNKEGVTVSVFYGVTACSNRTDTLFSLYFTMPAGTGVSLEKGGLVVLRFADGTAESLPDLQVCETAAGGDLTANCYLNEATWKKIMQVDVKSVTLNSRRRQFNIRIPRAYRDVIPGMMRMLYERGRAPYEESL